MCATYTPTSPDRIVRHFGTSAEPISDPVYKPVVFPGYMAPIIRAQSDRSTGARECIAACFGMVPHWADMKLAKQTYNARSETVATKSSYRHAWRQSHFCIIPADSIFEPCYEGGKAVRWQISQRQDQPLGIAGIWESRSNGPDGFPLVSFSMLTINANEHPIMRRFHKSGEEKRMVVILDPRHYDSWLHVTAEKAPHFLRQYPADRLIAEAASNPPAGNEGQGSLFAT
jgi:putative SOS response-associated peptidase YedK